jgi:hypothetical protein
LKLINSSILMIAAGKYLTWIAKPNIATEIRNFATLPFSSSRVISKVGKDLRLG